MRMGGTFAEEFSGDLFKNHIVEDLQTSLKKAVKSSPKTIVTAHYPRNNYETASARMHIEANLEKIRRNRNNKKGIKIYADIFLSDGEDYIVSEPDFAKIEMSYSEFCNMNTLKFVEEVAIPLAEKLKQWKPKPGVLKEPDPFNAFDGVPEEAIIKKTPVTLKCEVKLESVDESGDGETVVEPTRQKMRSMFLKATTNKNKYKFLIKSTLENKKYDYVEVNYNEDGLIVSLIKDENVEQSKSVNSTVAYRVVNEYIKCEDINIDSIEQDVLSQPPKPKQVQQSNNSSGAGCLTAAIPIVCFLIYIILKFF